MVKKNIGHFLEGMETAIWRIVSQTRGEGWLSCYTYQKQQMLFAECLTALGCEVSVAGGEGLGELAAACLAGVFSAESIFCSSESGPAQKIEGGDRHEYVLVEIEEEELWSLLAMWREDELSTHGRSQKGCFILRGLTRVINALETSGDCRIVQREVELDMCSISGADMPNPPNMTIVSGHLGSSVDVGLCSRMEYWRKVPCRSIQHDSALNNMREMCDVVVDVGTGTVYWRDGDALDAASTAELLANLFSVGCEIDWKMYSGLGPHARIPPYRLADSPV